MLSNRLFLRLTLVTGAATAWASVSLFAQQTPPTPPPAPPAPVIARVQGRPITQLEFDRIAQPYFERLRAQLKEGFTDDLKKVANRNVLDELIRRELLIVMAQRQKITVSEAETDEILRQDPFFLTNGKFDQGKFLQYKMSPGSNYVAVLPKVRELAAATRLDSTIRTRLKPTRAQARAEWAKRNDQVRFKFLSLGARDVSLEPESSEPEWAAYYAAHPDQFEKKPRIGLRYLRLPLPPEGDSLRTSSEAESLKRGKGLADSLRKNVPIDTLAESLGGATDTGLFDVPPRAIPGLGTVAELNTTLAHADSDTTIRVVGPAVAQDAVVVGVVAGRQRRSLPPMREVIADVKRRADRDKRQKKLDADKLAFYQAHRDTFTTRRLALTRVHLSETSVTPKPPGSKEVERWYAEHGRSLLAHPESLNTPLPPLSDSLRGVVSERMTVEARGVKLAESLNRLASDWRAGRDVRSLARNVGAKAETLSLIKGSAPDSLFPAPLVDSLFVGPPLRRPGQIDGPRPFAGRMVLWRIDALDTAFVPPFDAFKTRVDQAFQDDKRRLDENEAKPYFEARRNDYKTQPKAVMDYISVAIPLPDSVMVPESAIEKYYRTHQDAYRQEEQVRARHILISTRPAPPGGEAKARSRADSLLKAIRGGADFADLARRFSQDPGSAPQGGDLGFFARGRMVKEFSDSSFALRVGQVSQLVKTQYGYHIIKVEERKPAGVRPLSEVHDQIRIEMGQTRGDSLAKRNANGLRRKIAAGGDAAKLAAPYGGIATSPEFAISDPVPSLGPVPGLGDDLKTLPIGKWASKVYRGGISYVLVRPTKKIPAGLAEFAEVRQQAVDDMKNGKRKELLAQKVAGIRSELAQGVSLDSAAVIYGGLKDSGLLNESTPFIPFLGAEPRILSKAASLKPGTVTDTLRTAQGVGGIRVEEKKAVEGASFDKDEPAIVQELTAQKYKEWVDQKKKTVKIEILRADLREVPTPPAPRPAPRPGGQTITIPVHRSGG